MELNNTAIRVDAGHLHTACCAIEHSEDQIAPLESEIRWWRDIETPMLLIVGAVIVLTAVVLIPKMRVPGVNARALGWMSEQWLDNYRASHKP